MTKRDRKQKNELKVFISSRESICDECGENLGHGAWILLQENDNVNFRDAPKIITFGNWGLLLAFD
ncbi:MAG: hypothetical protein V3S16_07725 [Candidatus Desulfatibia sp.]|uniref:hypothetical protein n=1 Tax=Candidatus Desulfatibia sp. TaxID=3101189 RepID=UPI002F2F76C1